MMDVNWKKKKRKTSLWNFKCKFQPGLQSFFSETQKWEDVQNVIIPLASWLSPHTIWSLPRSAWFFSFFLSLSLPLSACIMCAKKMCATRGCWTTKCTRAAPEWFVIMFRLIFWIVNFWFLISLNALIWLPHFNYEKSSKLFNTFHNRTLFAALRSCKQRFHLHVLILNISFADYHR